MGRPSLWTSFKNLFRRGAASAAEAMDDPAGNADLHIEDAKAKAESYQSKIASAIAQNKRLKNDCQEAKDEEKKWNSIAERAAADGAKDDARTALEKAESASNRAKVLAKSIKNNDEVCSRLRKDLDKIRAKISDAEANKEILKARLASGQMRKELAKARSEFNSDDDLAALDNLNKAAMEEETEAEALEELTGGGEEALEEKYSANSSAVDDKLEKLMTKNGK